MAKGNNPGRVKPGPPKDGRLGDNKPSTPAPPKQQKPPKEKQ